MNVINWLLPTITVVLCCGFSNVEREIIVEPNDISVTEHGIYAILETYLIETQQIVKKEGKYVLKGFVPVDEYWVCPYCHRANPDNATRCIFPGCPSNRRSG